MTRWLVADGDSVAKDQPVAVMEAMKMEMTLNADRQGVIRHRAAAGADLAEGALLAELET